MALAGRFELSVGGERSETNRRPLWAIPASGSWLMLGPEASDQSAGVRQTASCTVLEAARLGQARRLGTHGVLRHEVWTLWDAQKLYFDIDPRPEY